MLKTIVKFIAIVTTILVSFSTPAFADPVANDLSHGEELFQANCAGCHARGGNIVRRGKNLKLKALHKNKVDTQDAIASLVTNGKNNMSAYGDRLTPTEITEISAYVLQQAEQGWK